MAYTGIFITVVTRHISKSGGNPTAIPPPLRPPSMCGSRGRNHSQREPLRKGRTQGQDIVSLCCHHLGNLGPMVGPPRMTRLLSCVTSPVLTNHSCLKGSSDSSCETVLLAVTGAKDSSTVSTALSKGPSE